MEKKPTNIVKEAIKAEKEAHRNKLVSTSNKALDLIEEALPTATIDQQIKAYDASRRHLNTLDGIENSNQTNQFFVIPAEMVINNYNSDKYKEQVERLKKQGNKIKENISQQKNQQSSSTHAKQKSPKTNIDSESSIVEGVLVKPSSQDKK